MSRHSTLTSRFLAGWEPTQLPPRGPDGLIPAPPVRALPVISVPSLCEAGPCRNYHRVSSIMDAAEPMDGSPGEVHEQVARACYPAPGIELELGESPVLRCSRWEPDGEQARLDSIRDQYLKTPAGRVFVAQAQAFEAAMSAADAGVLSDVEADEEGEVSL